jgi:hypothetical protein
MISPTRTRSQTSNSTKNCQMLNAFRFMLESPIAAFRLRLKRNCRQTMSQVKIEML